MVLLDSLVYEEPRVLCPEEFWKAIKSDLEEALAFTAGRVFGKALRALGRHVYEEYKGASLVILGMPKAGKTQFWKNLKGEPYFAYETTNVKQNYQPFDYRYGNRTMRINVGEDIRTAGETLIKESKIVVFIFDVSKYLKEQDYQLQTNACLELLYNKRNEFIGRDQKKFAVIASHPDQVDKVELEEADLVTRMKSVVHGKPYAALFYQNCWTCNLTNPKDFSTITEKLFANK